MTRHSLRKLIAEAQETTPTKDVLLAVSSALQGDRKGIQAFVGKARDRIEKRLGNELRVLRRSKSAPTTKKPKIRGARLSPPVPQPAVAPPGAVVTRLPDGRKARLVLNPTTARHQDMLALRQISRVNTKRAFTAIAHNGRAIDRLAASQRELESRFAKLQSSEDLALLRGMVEGLANLGRQVEGVKRLQAKALTAQKQSFQKKLARQARALEAQTRAAEIQKLHGAVAAVQSAAFGTKGSLLATNNLLLAANQLVWSFGPQILEALGLAKPGATSPMAWLAPFGSLLTSQVVLGRRQHERFVSGVMTNFTASGSSDVGVATLSLRSHIAAAEWESFSKRTDIPVTTVVLEPRGEFNLEVRSSGEVRDGILSIRIELEYHYSILLREVVVSWTVDTRRPNG